MLKHSRDWTLLLVILAFGAFPIRAAWAGPLQKEQLFGVWSGLKASQGFNGGALASMRTLRFLKDGTYVSTNPDVRGAYSIEGNTVTLPNLYVLTYSGERLSDGRGSLTRQKP